MFKKTGILGIYVRQLKRLREGFVLWQNEPGIWLLNKWDRWNWGQICTNGFWLNTMDFQKLSKDHFAFLNHRRIASLFLLQHSKLPAFFFLYCGFHSLARWRRWWWWYTYLKLHRWICWASYSKARQMRKLFRREEWWGTFVWLFLSGRAISTRRSHRQVSGIACWAKVWTKVSDRVFRAWR